MGAGLSSLAGFSHAITSTKQEDPLRARVSSQLHDAAPGCIGPGTSPPHHTPPFTPARQLPPHCVESLVETVTVNGKLLRWFPSGAFFAMTRIPFLWLRLCPRCVCGQNSRMRDATAPWEDSALLSRTSLLKRKSVRYYLVAFKIVLKYNLKCCFSHFKWTVWRY